MDEMDEMDLDEDDLDISGDEDDDDGISIGAGPALESALDRLRGVKKNPRKYVSQLSKMRVKKSLARDLHPKVVQTLHRMTRIAASVSSEMGRIDAYNLRRPNSLCCVYGTSMAPAATLAFSITPSGGQSWYRILSFLTGDDQAQVFGFTALQVGGLNQIFATQATPTAPVANASAWYGFVSRGDNQVFNLAPWTGTVFDNSVTVNGTIANMTVAATGDAITLAPRFLIPVQTDPCGQHSSQVKASAAKFLSNMRRSLAFYR